MPKDKLEQIVNGFTEAKILLAAAELKIFDHLRTPGATAAEVSEKIGGTQRGVEILLDALAAIEVIQKQGDIYSNMPEYEAELVSDSASQRAGMLRHRNLLFRNWAFLEEKVLGKPTPLPPRPNMTDPASNEAFIRAMYFASSQSVPTIVDHIDLHGCRNIADLGGGPGHYLAEFSRRAPEHEPYLIDLPLTLDAARKMALDKDCPKNFHYIGWDFYNDPSPKDLPQFDLIFISQVIHAAGPEANLELFSKLFPLITPGGRVVVHERVVDPGRTTPKDAAVFAVNMLIMTSAGRTYTEDEIVTWAKAAGFVLGPRGSERINERSHLIEFQRPGA